jgi:predicted SnoaL-like aldol condensation-catalyzing enzyme
VPIRVFQDGDFVFAHTEYDFFGPKIGFDIFRFEKGLIVEPWDNLQETASHILAQWK